MREGDERSEPAAELAAELAVELTRAFLDSPWTAERIAESGAACLGRWSSWMPALAQRVVAVHRTAPYDRAGDQVDDFRAYLLGRISWVESLNPARARRLRELSAAIEWP